MKISLEIIRKKLRKGTSGLLLGSIMLVFATIIIMMMVGFVQVYFGTTDIDNLTENVSRQIILCESRAEAYDKAIDIIDRTYINENIDIVNVNVINTDGNGWNNEDMISVEITGHISSTVAGFDRDYTSKKLVMLEKEDTFQYTSTSPTETYTIDFLRNRYNISPAGVAAVLANIYRECGGSFDRDTAFRVINIPGTTNEAYGIFRYTNLNVLEGQSGFDRRYGFMRYIYFGMLRDPLRPFEDYNVQLEFMVEEFDGIFNPSDIYQGINAGYSFSGVREKLLSAKDRHDAKEAAMYFMKVYEPYPFTDMDYEAAKEEMDEYIDRFFDYGHMDESY